VEPVDRGLSIYLSALDLAYAGSGDASIKDKLNYLIGALGECQDALNEEVGQPPPPTPPVGRAPGRLGNAVRLNGNGQYVALPAGIVGGLTDITIALWVNPAATTTWSRIFDFGTGTTRYLFLTVSAGSAPRFAITTGGAGAEQRINGTGPLATNRWTHVAVTLAGNTGTLYRPPSTLPTARCRWSPAARRRPTGSSPSTGTSRCAATCPGRSRQVPSR
jgi:hypothetical protein